MRYQHWEQAKRCACGRSYTWRQWYKLSYVGRMEQDGLELRNCMCGSTIAVESPDRVARQ